MGKKHYKYYLGKTDGRGTGKKDCEVYITWTLDEEAGTFSMCAETWLPSKRDIIEGGQMVDRAAGYFPEDKLAARMVEVWRRWHLNHLKAGCEHQRETWQSDKPLSVVEYTWSSAFCSMRTMVEQGLLSLEEYKHYAEHVKPLTYICTIGLNSPKYPFELVQQALDEGWIREGKRETKLAHWVDYREHPEGLLSKPCPVCGYKYGSAWLKEELPPEVIAEIKSWAECKSPEPQQATD